MDIYGAHRPAMERVMKDLVGKTEACCGGDNENKLYEHLRYRIKSDESAREKLVRKGLEPTAENAVSELKDAIGLRIVCLFIDDVYECVRRIRSLQGCTVLREKDYIRDAKPNGYRSYHMILDVASDEAGADGSTQDHYYAEIQLRTIAMDTWAALEHELKYKKNISNQEMIIRELHRCANDLAACDISMQTIRQIIRES
jgi:GTP pyrophosphokinase